jgi:hypothetical protein
LKIIERGRWVRPYLRYYLRCVEDDRCSISKNSLLPCHFATWEEELLKISEVSFECLAALFRQVSKVGLRMLFLLKSDSLLPEFPPFMLDVLEVLDSPVELPKCVATGVSMLHA